MTTPGNANVPVLFRNDYWKKKKKRYDWLLALDYFSFFERKIIYGVCEQIFSK